MFGSLAILVLRVGDVQQIWIDHNHLVAAISHGLLDLLLAPSSFMGAGIVAPSPSNNDIFFLTPDVEPPLRLVPPLEPGGLYPCLVVVVLLSLQLHRPLDASLPLLGASRLVSCLGLPTVHALA